MSSITMIFAFLVKEIHDIRRQPRLLVSLVGGPLLVLGMFGATFRSVNPSVTMALVWPAAGIPGVDKDEAIKLIGTNLTLARVTSDEAEAIRLLDAGQVDVVQIMPDVGGRGNVIGAPLEIRLVSREINPNAEAWIRSVGYVEVNTINQQLLTYAARDAQRRAVQIEVSLADARSTLGAVEQAISPEQVREMEDYIQQLQDGLRALLGVLPDVARARVSLAPSVGALRDQVVVLQRDLEQLDGALGERDMAARRDHLRETRIQIDSVKGAIKVFVDTPAENIITPVLETYTNLRGGAYSLVVFYAPGVLALLVQQLAITLAGIGLVRERQMGAFEMFRVSPLRFGQILVGKSLAYVLISASAGGILTALLSLLGVPLPVSPPQYALMLLLLAGASVGLGTLVSALSRTDAQAIQFTLLLLLLSVFFSGFFLPVSGFIWPAWIVSASLPMTHALWGFQTLMLSATHPSPAVWVGLGSILALSFLAVMLIMRGQYKRVLD